MIAGEKKIRNLKGKRNVWWVAKSVHIRNPFLGRMRCIFGRKCFHPEVITLADIEKELRAPLNLGNLGTLSSFSS